jgi:pyruvyltransferase
VTAQRVIKTYYAQLPNMGDLLNELLIRDVFNQDLRRHAVSTCELSVIGSGMDCFMSNTYIYPKYYSLYSELRAKFTSYPVNVWCTGFIFKPRNDTSFIRDMKFHSVRGELTKARVEKIIGEKLDIPTGDGGLITPYLLKKKEAKKYEVGIIAHFKEQSEPAFEMLKNKYDRSVFINLRDDPIEVIKQIAQCEYVISSSLHGLIVADSFNIPNQWVVVTDNLKGDGFKFDDYYSAFGLQANPLNLAKTAPPELNEIIDQYKFTPQMIEAKQKAIYGAFPFKR